MQKIKYRHIPNNILKAMVNRGLTQKTLSEITGIPNPTINRYIKGYRFPRYDYAVKIAEVLKIPVSEIYADSKGIKKELIKALSVFKAYCNDTPCEKCIFKTCREDSDFVSPIYWEVENETN